MRTPRLWPRRWLIAVAFAVQAPSACTADAAETYVQTLEIEFRDEACAAAARVTVEPLFDGCRRAVSCRWDDNWTSDNLRTRAVMEEYGIRGTWYLNDPFFVPGGAPADYTAIARQLLVGGNSIGGHSLTHPYLTYFHSQRMFAETSGVRIAWEAALDRPVTSYAFSFVDLRPPPEGAAVLRRALATLERAGYRHVAEYLSFFSDIDLQLELSPIMPSENNSFETFAEAVDWAYRAEAVGRDFPMISNSMHAWYDTPRLAYGYDELRRRLAYLAQLKDVWHCNHNEFAAYRLQCRSAQLRPLGRQGAVLRISLQRPRLRMLGADVPLTLAVSGVAGEDVREVRCSSAKVVASSQPLQDGKRFHVCHDAQQRLPERIGHIANPENVSGLDESARDADFPELRGRLWREADRLVLELETAPESPLADVALAWRAPVGWDVVAEEVASSERQFASRTYAARLSPRGATEARIGRAHFAAELDFSCGDRPGRLHFTCETPGLEPDDSWPKDGFAVLGPLDSQEFDAAQFVAEALQHGCPSAWEAATGEPVRWRKAPRDGYVEHDWLNPEYVRTMGTWDSHSPAYVLRSRVTSPERLAVRIITSHPEQRTVLLNRKLVDGEPTTLQRGENELLIVYPASTMSVETPRLTACFVRIADPATGDRIERLRYQPF